MIMTAQVPRPPTTPDCPENFEPNPSYALLRLYGQPRRDSEKAICVSICASYLPRHHMLLLDKCWVPDFVRPRPRSSSYSSHADQPSPSFFRHRLECAVTSPRLPAQESASRSEMWVPVLLFAPRLALERCLIAR